MPAIAREKLWTRDFVFGTAVNFLIMVNYYGLMVVVADYAMKTYDAPAATAGLAASIFVIGALIARLFSGRIMDRVGRKRLLIIGAVLEVAFSALYLAGLGLWLLFALRLLHGIAFGTCSTAIAPSSRLLCRTTAKAKAWATICCPSPSARQSGRFWACFSRRTPDSKRCSS